MFSLRPGRGSALLLPGWMIKTAGRWSHVGGPVRVSLQEYLVDLVVFTNRGTQRNTEEHRINSGIHKYLYGAALSHDITTLGCPVS